MSLTKWLTCLPVIGLASLFSQIALTEGAVKTLECDIARVCDGSGNCEAGRGQAQFRMEPERIETGGVGTYSISYGEKQAQMQAISDTGPFLWTIGTERDALIPSSETDWLWHQLELDPVPKATVRFLVCAFRQ